MLFKISDGSFKDIVLGSLIQVVPGYLPDEFNGVPMSVVRVDESGPYVVLEPKMLAPDEELPVNAMSCISSQIIKTVY